MARKKRRRKRRRRISVKAILTVLGVVVVLAALGYAAVVLFQTKKIDVTGTVYSSPQDVVEWVQKDKYSSNTLYILWKYNQNDLEQPPAIESTKVSLKSPWQALVQVKEKTFSGRVDYNGESLYFDEEGIVSLVIPDIIEGVPYIEGMAFDAEKVKIGELLPVSDEQVFVQLSEVTALLEKKELVPDKISCEENHLTVHFGGIRVQLGSSGYADKLEQVPPLLAKMGELYAGQTGVFHLENYTTSDSSIRFEPDPPPEQTEE